jgi:uncharacterized protein YjlB
MSSTDANPTNGETHRFADEATRPLVIYRGVLPLDGEKTAIECERLFARNGWQGAWQNGIYPYHHFHATTHEVLGIARGRAAVRFGGEGGETLQVEEGDVVVIPAGVSHCRERASEDLLVVGAYPGGAEPDIQKELPVASHPPAADLDKVPLPEADPVFGAEGPLLRHWTQP